MCVRCVRESYNINATLVMVGCSIVLGGVADVTTCGARAVEQNGSLVVAKDSGGYIGLQIIDTQALVIHMHIRSPIHVEIGDWYST